MNQSGRRLTPSHDVANFRTFNQIQFQPSMSIPKFVCNFGTDAQRTAAVKFARWSQDFLCPRCSSPNHYDVDQCTRPLFHRQGCKRQTALTAGSLMEHIKLPLTTWFLANYMLSQAQTGLTSLALKHHLGVNYPTAWLLHQQGNRAIAKQDCIHRLGAQVQIEDAYLSGERAAGKSGRGSENKAPLVASMAVNDAGRPTDLKLNLLSGIKNHALGKWTKANIVLGNLRTTLAGACHAQRYLVEFAYRLNRRIDLRGLASRLFVDAARAQPRMEQHVRAHAVTR